MNILVTGAAGFIWSHLAEALFEQGHQVLGIDNFAPYYAPAIKHYTANQLSELGCNVIELDLATANLKPYLNNIDAVYHCAAQSGLSSHVPLKDYLRNNIEATQNLLETLAEVPSLQRFINIATSSIYGAVALGTEDAAPAPVSYYGVTKLAAEQLVMAAYRQRRFPVTSVRLFSVYGPRERPDKLYPRLIRSILDGVPFPLYTNSWIHKRSFTFVDDVVKALVLTLTTDACIGEIINVGTTESITTGQTIEIVEQLMGKRAVYIEKPPRIGDQERTAAMIEKAQTLLGYHPDTPFHQGIRKEIDWMIALPEELRACYSAST